MKRTRIGAVCLLGLMALSSWAVEGSHRDAAVELITVARTERMLDQMKTAMEGMMRQQFATIDLPPEGVAAAEKAQADVLAWFMDVMSWEKMRSLYVDLYTDVFSEEEIRGLTQFYRSPLGQKMLDKMPELIEKAMLKTQAIVMEKMPELQQRMQKSVEELEKTYKK
ncbi:MAG: DUF2059 domain-containing protein [Kiritimatiellia bacterium]|nr:DUF2059 domain-containing protein [Kiritimatiellia bacterium]